MASVGCCLFDLDAIKPWININIISIKDSFQCCGRVHDNKAVDNPMKPKDIDN